MNHIIRSRGRARLLSILLIAAITAVSALTFQVATARAEEPSTPPASGDTTTTTSGDTGSSGAVSDGAGAGGVPAAAGGDGGGGGGDGAAAGGSNTAGNGTDSTGGGATATGGTGSADSAGDATSTNTAISGVPADAGPGSTTATNTVTDDQTGATGSTGATQTETASAPAATTSSTGAGNPGVTPATPEAPTAPTPPAAPTAASNANVSTGNATAVGNMSQTDIVQIVIAIVNITMPNVNAADIVGPLVTINQTAEVTNAGIASALTGGNTAVASLISTVAGGGQVSAQQLAGLATSGTADVNSGAASAVGNLSWTEVMQIASVITSVNGDTSLTSQLTQIQQNASITNAGSATADTGGNNASVSVSVSNGAGNGNGGGSDDAVDPNPGGPNPPAGAQAEVDPYPGDTNHRVLLWGPAPSEDAVVWIYVDGRECKTAKIEESVDFKGAYDWWSYVYPGECGAKNGSRMTFLVGAKMKESVVFDNRKRESPQITFQALIQTDLAAKGARR